MARPIAPKRLLGAGRVGNCHSNQRNHPHDAEPPHVVFFKCGVKPPHSLVAEFADPHEPNIGKGHASHPRDNCCNSASHRNSFHPAMLTSMTTNVVWRNHTKKNEPYPFKSLGGSYFLGDDALIFREIMPDHRKIKAGQNAGVALPVQ